MKLAGKTAVVTGGLSGIGAAVAARFVAEGAQVVAADISAPPGIAGHGMTLTARLDVTDEAACAVLMQAVRNRFGRLDLLVNSAGIGRDTPFLDTQVAEFDRILAVNLRGTFLIGQAAARLMQSGGGGVIVNIASVSGQRGNIGRAAYGASKGGVITLSKVMATELAALGIRVNVISPGPVETPLVATIHTPAIRENWNRDVPMGRYGTAEEIAGAAAFLCSDDASYITGHVLAVDGGFLGAGLTGR